MNKNKGIIGIGLIVAIVLGIVVVGGGAYYLGKSGSKPVVINSENILPNNENQNLPVVDNSQQVNVANPTTPTVTTGCTSTSTPSIKVLSPNGGETYTIGQKITVKWSSCNLAKSTPIQILLQGNFSGGAWDISPMSNFILSNGGSTLNSGSAIFTLPALDSGKWTGNTTGMKYGSYYKIYISQNLSDAINASDMSDNSFTINSAPTNISTTNWKTYTNADYGFSFKYPSEWARVGEERKVVNREGVVSKIEIEFNDSVTKSHLLVNYSIFNGLELYNYALGQFDTSAGWYTKNAEKMTILGSVAIRANSISDIDGRGNKINPPDNLTLVDFMDDNNIGGFDIQFRIPSTNYEKEIIKFNQLLSTFKFTK